MRNSHPLDDPSPHIARGESIATSRSARSDAIVEQLRTCTDEAERARLRGALIAVTMPVARAIASRYRSRGVPAEDLDQIAYLALVKAVQRFDPAAGHHFMSFCVPTIRGEVRRHFRDHGWMVRPPRRIQELQQRVTRARADLTHRLGRPPGARELAEHLGEEIDDVLEAMDGNGCYAPSSLDLQAGRGDATVGDLLSADPEGIAALEARLVLGPVISRLGDRDRRIIALRFFDGLTQREIAEELGVTQMQVSRLLSKIFHRLRDALGPLETLPEAASS